MRFSLFVHLQLLCTRKDPHNKAMTTGIVNVCVVIFTIEYRRLLEDTQVKVIRLTPNIWDKFLSL
jgi:hypothetical protein